MTPPAPNTFSVGNQVPEPSSNKFVLMFVAGLVIIILLVGGIYLYLSRQQAPSEVGPTPTPVVQENLEDDLNSIDITSIDNDFTSVDSDLQQL